MEDKKIPLFGFQVRNVTTGSKHETRSIAASKKAIDGIIAEWNEQFKPETYEAISIVEYTLTPADAKAIGGYLLGSLSNPSKATAAKTNGKKGGRPKGTGKKQKAAAAAAKQAVLDTIPLNTEVIPVETKKPSVRKKI